MPRGGISDFDVSGQSDFEFQLWEERNQKLPDEIDNSPLKTKIKRVDTKSFDLISPNRSLNLGGGVTQKISPDIKNKFQSPSPNNGGSAYAYGDNGQKQTSNLSQPNVAPNPNNSGDVDKSNPQLPPQVTGNAYDDNDIDDHMQTSAPLQFGGAYDDEPNFGPNQFGGAYDDDVNVEKYFAPRQSDNSGNGSNPNPLSQPDKPGSQDFKYQQVVNFSANTRSRNSDYLGRNEELSKTDVERLNRYQSTLDRYRSKNQSKASGIEPKSPHARINYRTQVSKDFQKKFFRERMHKLGFYSSDHFEKDDPRSWSQKFELGRQAWADMFGEMTKKERGAFAFDMALISAGYKSAVRHGKDRQPVKIERDPDDHSKFSMKGAIASAIDQSEANKDQFRLLTDDAIEKGVKTLDWFLNPKHDPEEHFADDGFLTNVAGKIKGWVNNDPPKQSERQQMKDAFRAWCREYNEQIRENIQNRDERRKAMATSPLKELGMDVSMPEEVDTDKLFQDVENQYVESRKFDVGFSIFATVANAITLGWAAKHSEFIRRHFDNVWNAGKLHADLKEQYEESVKDQLYKENYESAKNWVLDQYKFDPDDIRGVDYTKLFDPHNFYAAFGTFEKHEIVQNIKEQLARSAGFDLKNPPKPNADDKAANDTYQRFQIFAKHVDTAANAIFDGMADALHERAGDQLKLRAVSRTTHDADTYVTSSNATMRLNCHRAWRQLDTILDNVDSPELRQSALQTIQRSKGYIQEIADELASSDEETGSFVGAPIHDGEEFHEYTLPPDGERRAVLNENIAAAHEDTNAALKTAQKLDAVIGQKDDPNSVRGIQAALKREIINLAYAKDDVGTQDEVKERFEALEDAFKSLVLHADALEDSLTEEQNRKLTGTLKQLENELKDVRTMHGLVNGVHKQLLEAKSLEDITNTRMPAAQFDTRLDLIADFDVVVEDFGAGIGKTLKEEAIRDLRNTMKAEIDSTKELFKAYKAGEDAIGDLEQKVLTQQLSLREATQKAIAAADSFAQTKSAHEKQTFFNAPLYEKFDGMADGLDQRIARMLPASLGIAVDENTKLSPDALATIKKLFNAGLTSDVIVSSLKAELDHNKVGQAPTLKEFEELLNAIGHNASQVRNFAESVFAGIPETSLNFQIEMMRQNGADDAALRQIKRNFYTLEALRAVYDAQDAVNSAYVQTFDNDDSKNVGSNKPSQKSSNYLGVPPSNLNYETDDDGVISVNTSDDEENDAPFNPQRYVLRTIDQAVELSATHDVFTGHDKKWITQAAADLKQLIDTKNDKDMSPEAISRARIFAAEMQSLSLDNDDLKTGRQKAQHAVSDQIRRQIAAEFGLDPNEDLKDPQKVKDVTAQSVTDKNNAAGMQDITRRANVVRSLMSEQQNEAELIKGAVIQPLKDFAELLDGDVDSPEAVLDKMQSPEFQSKAKVLRDLCLLDDARQIAQHKEDADLTDSDIYRSNLMAMKQLAPRVRGFDPSTLRTNNRFVNELAMWWKGENEFDVAKNVLDNGGGNAVAEKFQNVWKHMSMLNAIAESNEDLMADLEALQSQHDSLATKVQQHRQDQVATLAVLEEFAAFGGSTDEFKFDETTVNNIKSRLESWGQSLAWNGFAERNTDLMENGLSTAKLQEWKATATGLPAELQNEFDALSTALTNFETLIKQTSDYATKLAGTPVDPKTASNYNANLTQQTLTQLPKAQAAHQFGNLLHPDARWHKHRDWKGPSVDQMATMTPTAFTNELKAGLATFVENIDTNRSTRNLSDDSKQKDRQWVESLTTLVTKTAEFHELMDKTMENRVAGLPPTKARIAKLKEMAKEIDDLSSKLDQYEAGPSNSHRYPYKGPRKVRRRMPTSHFLNQMDAALRVNIPQSVNSRIAKLG